jgi:predicted nucleotidyltransferase
VDVLVEFDETPSLRPFIATLELLEQAVGRRVDLLTPGALDRRLAERIESDLVDAA